MIAVITRGGQFALHIRVVMRLVSLKIGKGGGPLDLMISGDMNSVTGVLDMSTSFVEFISWRDNGT